MEVTTQEFKQCNLITVKGRVDSATAAQLGEALEETTKSGQHKIVLDMSEVEQMSSAGMRVLIVTQKECKRLNRGEVVLAVVSDRIKEALDLVGFTPLFTIFDEVAPAVGYF